jgi:hypothetical protein
MIAFLVAVAVGAAVAVAVAVAVGGGLGLKEQAANRKARIRVANKHDRFIFSSRDHGS